MIETLTIFDGRVAQAFDYPDNKTSGLESFRTGPAKIGGTPLAIDFDPKTLRIKSIIDLDTMDIRRIEEWPAKIGDAIRAHIGRYAARYANLGGAA